MNDQSDKPSEGEERFAAIPRSAPKASMGPDAVIDRWPAVRSALEEMLGECAQIMENGKDEFFRSGSLTYRAAEAIIVHFQDIIETRLPDARKDAVAAMLPLAAVRRTRNIVAHNYLAADKAIIWSVINNDIPAGIRAILKVGR